MPSAWLTHVKKTFEAGKKKKAGYSYKQAMIDGKKTYKKKSAPVKKGKKRKAAAIEEEEKQGGALKRRVQKKKKMKILSIWTKKSITEEI